ncbi:MAG: hypothetical protein DRH89_07450, partial [Candidatus Cloacimonadota bacterium]
MKNIRIDLVSILILVFLTSCLMFKVKDNLAEDQAIYSQMGSELTKSDSIQLILAEVVNDGKAPGMIAAIISSEGVIAISSAGVRKAGSNIAFTINDVVHLGSCGKAMTATMLATLVEDGKLSWDMKLIEAIPELKNKIHAGYKNITLWQLLTHRAGLPKNPIDELAHTNLEIKERRLSILKDNIIFAPANTVGEWYYSNFGYIIAACMAEQVTGLSWEVLIKKRLFEPLGMTTAGIGDPINPLKNKSIDQPWGHKKSWLGNKWNPSRDYYGEVISPAGRVYCSIEDWAKFISLQLPGDNTFLDRTILNKLIEPVGFYAAGWVVLKEAEQPWAKGIVLVHGGSN